MRVSRGFSRVFLAASLIAIAALRWPLGAQTAPPPSAAGQWSGVMSWPAVAVHTHLLKNGKVMTWESGATATVWNPADGLFMPAPNTFTDILCSGHIFLADGRLMSIGGWDRTSGALGVTDVSLFDPDSQSWKSAAPMSFRRWYPTGTQLGDGRILVVSGDQRSQNDIAATPEIYDPALNRWTSLTAAANAIPVYPFLFQLPDGRVLQAGSSEVATSTQALDVASRTWSVVDSRLIDGASAVMYSPGRILKAGTAADSGNSGTALATAFVIDMTQAKPAWQATGSMAFRRSFMNLTALPDGTVLASGGGTDRSAFNTANAVLPVEILVRRHRNVDDDGEHEKPRLYHSTALLLPDARVLIAGGGADSAWPISSRRSCSRRRTSSTARVRRSRARLRRSLYNTSFSVSTPDGSIIASAALIATGSVTHAFNQTQRFVPLAFSQKAGGLNLAAPVNGSTAPPGYYMLFLVNAAGVPSEAAIVNVGGASGPTQVIVPNVVGQTQPAASSAITTAGLTVGGVTTASSNTVPQGSVISQNPAAGVSVAAATAVSLVISTGPAPTTVAVPDVTNQTQATASAILTAARLTTGAITAASSTTVPAGVIISQSPAAGATVAVGSAVALVISSGPQGEVPPPPPAPTAPVVDKTVFSDGLGTRTTAAFSTTSANELVVAFVASDGPNPGAQGTTITGAGLSWTLVQRVNAQAGVSEIWAAKAPAALTNATVTSTQASGSFYQSLTVVTFIGAAGVGASAGDSDVVGAPSVSLTTTHAGSLVYGVGNDWDDAAARTLPANQALVHQYLAPAGDTFWAQNLLGSVGIAGTTIAISDTGPTTDRWNLAVVEIVAAAQPVTVPDVVNATQAAATTAITNATLTVGAITSAPHGTVPAGSVISQSPAAGAQVAAGSAVALVVSTGPFVTTPDVVGKSQAAASSAIAAAGLVVGTVTTAPSASAAGTVLSEDPAAGTQAVVGSAVNLVVSSGKLVVPDVTNQTQAAASTTLIAAGLTVGAITTQSSATVAKDLIISQTPAAGAAVAPGSAVAIVVSSGPPPVVGTERDESDASGRIDDVDRGRSDGWRDYDAVERDGREKPDHQPGAGRGGLGGAG